MSIADLCFGELYPTRHLTTNYFETILHGRLDLQHLHDLVHGGLDVLKKERAIQRQIRKKKLSAGVEPQISLDERLQPGFKNRFIQLERGRMDLTRMFITVFHHDSAYALADVSGLPIGEYKPDVKNNKIRYRKDCHRPDGMWGK
jgi:hypothetical protein